MSNTKITPSVKAKITWLNDDPSGAKKAAATITIAEAFQVHGVSIVEGPKGLFISMPQRQTTDKKFLEVAHPVTAEMRTSPPSARPLQLAFSISDGCARIRSSATRSAEAARS